MTDSDGHSPKVVEISDQDADEVHEFQATRTKLELELGRLQKRYERKKREILDALQANERNLNDHIAMLKSKYDTASDPYELKSTEDGRLLFVESQS